MLIFSCREGGTIKKVGKGGCDLTWLYEVFVYVLDYFLDYYLSLAYVILGNNWYFLLRIMLDELLAFVLPASSPKCPQIELPGLYKMNNNWWYIHVLTLSAQLIIKKHKTLILFSVGCVLWPSGGFADQEIKKTLPYKYFIKLRVGGSFILILFM